MSQLLEEHDELLAASGRELTLSTGAILSIFVGLALLCGLFFGFGYNVGRKAGATTALAVAPQAAEPSTSSTGANETFGGFKPPAATPAKASPSAAPSRQDEAESAATPNTASEIAKTSPPAHSDSAVKTAPLSSPSKPEVTNTPAHNEAPTVGPAGTFFVQVAAVSHPDDATMLMGALRARGYAITQRSEPGDKLIHIQLGPFGNKAAAEAMRQRLQGDGYNAILK